MSIACKLCLDSVKQLDKLVIRSFIGPYVMSFFVAEFVLVMQFLWKYIDEIIGKGFSVFVLIELIFYYAVTIIPMAVPISVLISSVMVYGDMSEKYELSSFKSAGVSLLRIMRPALYIALLTAGFSLFSSNYLKPKANYKFFSRFDSIRKQKPSLTIEEGIFNDDFKGFAIRVSKKAPDERSISDILIYDHSDRDAINVTVARSGEMYTTEDGRYFIMNLFDGEQYKEMKPGASAKKRGSPDDVYPFLRTSFREWKKVFDMSVFDFTERSANLGRRNYDLLNSYQLILAIDSVNNDIDQALNKNDYEFGKLISTSAPPEKKSGVKRKETDQTKTISKSRGNELNSLTENNLAEQSGYYFLNSRTDPDDMDSLKSARALLKPEYLSMFMYRAGNAAKSVRETSRSVLGQVRSKERSIRLFKLRLHQQYSWAMICIIFLFIGAPLGSIVRKGGYGYPLLIAIIFFMLFIILMIMGEKLNKSEALLPELAAWLPCVVLLPVSIWLTIKALKDRKLLNSFNLFEWIAMLFENRKNTLSHEQIDKG